MSASVTCEACGYTSTAETAEILRGDWRKPCPVCQPNADDQEKEED